MATQTAKTSLTARPIFYNLWHDGKKVHTRHFYEQRLLSWGTSIEERMNPSISNSDVTYNVNHDMHYLEGIYMRYKTPTLRVKSECAGFVRIAFTPLLMHNIIKSAEMKLGSISLSMNSKVMDLCADRFMKPDMRRQYMENAGNKPALIEWRNELESTTLETPQWWDFCEDRTRAIPIHMTEKDQVKFVYTYNTEFKDLVRMRVYRKQYDAYLATRDLKKKSASSADRKGDDSTFLEPKDEWVEIPFDHKCLVDEKSDISGLPEMFALYSYRDQEEVGDWKECKDVKARSYNVTEFKQLTCDNSVGYGTNAVITKENIRLPIRRVAYMAENSISKANRNHSNYSTDPNGEGDESPCKSWSLSIGNIEKFKEQPCTHSRFISSWYGLGVASHKPGIHMEEFVCSEWRNDHLESLTASDGKIRISVKINSDERRGDQTKFDLIAFIQVVHVIEYKLGSDGKWVISEKSGSE